MRFRLLLGILAAAGAAFSGFVASVLIRYGASAALPEVALRTFVSLLLVVVGLWVGFTRPDLPTTRSAALALFLTGVLWLRNAIHDQIPLLGGADAFIFYCFDVAYPLHLVFGLRFFVDFPPGAAPSRALRAARAVNDVVGVGLLAVAKIVELRPFVGLGGLGPLDWIYDNRSFYTGSALLAIVVAMVRNYRRAPDADARRRVRWIVAGALVALVPDMVARFAKALGHELPIELFTVVAVAALPLTFAYAVVQHRVLDIQVVVHRSLSYLLARNVLRVLVAIPALALIVDVLLDPNRTVRQLFFDSWPRLLLLGLAGLALRFHAPLHRLIDRLFQREIIGAEEVLERLLARLQSSDSADDIAGAVSEELEAAFHPRSFSFLRSDAVPAELAARLAGVHEPVDHAGALAVPVHGGGDGLSGVMVVGRKSSGQAWQPGDRRLLGVIGAQIGYALEARALRDRVVDEQRTTRAALARLNPMKECPTCGRCCGAELEQCPDDGARLELGLPVEQTIDGKYRLERRIGRGGMGAVYRAQDLGLGRAVAVKILVGGKVGDPSTLRRFEREGRAMGRLAHPGVVAVHDFGRIGSDGAYLAMELLEGRTLRDAIDRGRSAPAQVAAWFGPILDAVGAAHRAGVVHRDLKPENVFLTRAGGVKVLDFGLARFLQPGVDSSVTVPGLLIGTLGYIAPEQFLGKEADAQSDVFSLAVMVFEALTGEMPFPGKTIAELATSVFVEEPHLPGDGAEARALDRALGRCLAASRRRRLATVAEMARVLLPALEACKEIGPGSPTSTPRRGGDD